MKKHFSKFIVLLIGCIYMFISMSGFCDEEDLRIETRRAPLEGLKGVYVIINYLDESSKDSGLSKNDLKNRIESKLRQKSIPIVSENEVNGFIYLTIQPIILAVLPIEVARLGMYFYVLKLECYQQVSLLRDPSIIRFVSTWDANNLGVGYMNKFVKDVNENVDEKLEIFIEDYLAVNPKKEK